ncbi:MAG: AAA family ATPase [Micromonosporaceae bacterium]|nr:AAA family ATPase [Micromonosporaceae bacterium]
MLRSFRVANHKSIKDEQELLLMPAYSKERPVVPVTAIFGANASGKTNLLDALRWMQAAVRESFASWEPGGGVPRQPFRLAPESAKEPSLFVLELVIKGVRWTYGFTVDDERVSAEWLFTYPHNRRRLIFERDGAKWTFGTGIGKTEAILLSDLTRDNALFLSVASRSGYKWTAAVYDWFQRGIGFSAHDRTDLVDAVTDRLEKPEAERQKFVELVRAADFGITEVGMRPSDLTDIRGRVLDPNQVSKQMNLDVAEFLRLMDGVAPHELVFLHGGEGVSMRLRDQSAGTISWLGLLTDSLAALESGSVLCIDEVDTSLHPRLTARLIELFQNETTNANGAQLVFTTHDATLLGTSFGAEILARDQIWFVEKDAEGRTSFFPLSDFHPRKDENTERRYLGGSYGAVPAVFSNSLVDRLQRLQGSTGAAA